MIRRLLLPALAAAFATAPIAGPTTGGAPRYTGDGKLLRPEGIDRWILVGASLGLGYSDVTGRGPGMFHRVYLEPAAYDHFLRTGRFRRGTMLALSIRAPERQVPPSRAGWTEGELAALEMAVKDPARFAGGWAYFSFGVDAAPARPLPPERCARCHAEHAAVDHVFVQFYPQLRGR
jgi:hypothetical protein